VQTGAGASARQAANSHRDSRWPVRGDAAVLVNRQDRKRHHPRERGDKGRTERFAPGVSRDAGLAAVASDIKGLPGSFVNAAERPASVVSLASIAGLPVALSGLLALMAAATLAPRPAPPADGAATWRS
jgi:hypothetical protein